MGKKFLGEYTLTLHLQAKHQSISVIAFAKKFVISSNKTRGQNSISVLIKFCPLTTFALDYIYKPYVQWYKHIIMLQQLTLETEQALDEGKNVLPSATEEIFQTRMLSSNSKEYNNFKTTELSIFQRELPNSTPEDIWLNYSGLIGESLFFLACKENDIPIKIASGNEDWAGIDFYIFGYPIDVTTSYARGSIERKVDTKRYSTIFLPRYLGNNSIHTRPTEITPYTKILFDTGTFNTTQYIDEMLQINYEIEQIVENEVFFKNSQPIHPKRAGINNIHNMKTIMSLISGVL